MKIKEILNDYISKIDGLKGYCDRCLRTERWGASVPLMIVDAAFTSIGLNYFTAVVPKVMKFKEDFIEEGIIRDICDLAEFDYKRAFYIWKNKRSWEVIRKISEYLCRLKRRKKLNDREAFRLWAKNSDIEKLRDDPIFKIKGVGINTFQYLRMMGGIDTVMPDKIVKRVLNKIFEKAGMGRVEEDIKFIKKIHEISSKTGIRAIEMCWMTWLIQREGKYLRIEKYKEILKFI